MTSALVVSFFLVVGAAWTLIAAIGILRMPDVLTRMHPATKAASLGLGCVMLAVAVSFAEVGVATRSLLVVLFVFLTAPVAAQRIGHAAYTLGEEPREGTVRDDLEKRRSALPRSAAPRDG